MESKSFYHRASDVVLAKKAYITPLERKAIRNANNITLEQQIFKPSKKTGGKENKSVKAKKTSKAKKPLDIVSVKHKDSPSPRPKGPKVNWAPSSLNRSFSPSIRSKKTCNSAIFQQAFQRNKSCSNLFPEARTTVPSKAAISDVGRDTATHSPPAKVSKSDSYEKSTSPGEEKSKNLEVGSNSGEDTIPNTPPPDLIRPETVTDDLSNFNTSASSLGEGEKVHDAEDQTESKKFFPIFGKVIKQNKSPKPQIQNAPVAKNRTLHIAAKVPKSGSPGKKSKVKNSSAKQLIIDAGQKRFGATQCSVCGMIYSASHPIDEQDHSEYHRRFLSLVKFKGWKNERVIASFMDGRIIKVTSGDPKYALKKVSDILAIVDKELGIRNPHSGFLASAVVYLFVSDDEKVSGCIVAEKISESFRLVQGSGDGTPNGGNALCFKESTPRPAVCGVSRVWTCASMRRRNIATRLLNALRDSFVLGTMLEKNQIAFSDPTADGRAFASKYFDTPNILVYNVQQRGGN